MYATPAHKILSVTTVRNDVTDSPCRHCSERSQSEARLRSQLESSSRKSERLHDDVKALTATKCELEAEVGDLSMCLYCRQRHEKH